MARESTEQFLDIREGNLCLVTMMGQHFMVRIVEANEDSIRISFPGGDYPVDGMNLDLEFHDEQGFNCYRALVLEGPRHPGDGVRLAYPKARARTYHRTSCRIPTDLTVQVKDSAHVRHYDAELLNLSGGGALLRTDAPFDFSTTVEMTLSLPGEPPLVLLGQIVHLSDMPDHQGHGHKSVGMRFISPDPSSARFITQFVWQRLRALYSE